MPRRQTVVTTTALTLLLSCLGATTAHADPATDLYVDQTSTACSDNGTGTQAAPYCGIQAAADAAQPGQTVHVSGQSYNKPVVITHSGTAGAPITFDTASSGPAAIYAQQATALTLSGVHDITIRGFTVYGAGPSTLSLVNAHHIQLDQLYVSRSEGNSVDGIDVDGGSSDVTVSRSQIRDASGSGLVVRSGADAVQISSDSFSHDLAGGIQADGTSNLSIAGDSFDLTCGSAVGVTGTSSGSIENIAAEHADPRLCSSGPATEISVSAASAATIHSDYNAVMATARGTDYNWAGTAYASSALFRTATGQGLHDLDHMGANDADYLSEGSPLIDSADANAAGEWATDLGGNARVDDPLVSNTGTGSGYVDRGAFEFQDPFRVTDVALSPAWAPTGVPVTATAVLQNPWSTPASYTFDFGDGTPRVQSSSPSVPHVYTHTPTSDSNPGDFTVQVTAVLPGGASSSSTTKILVSPPAPLVAHIATSEAPDQPLDVDVVFTDTSPYTITDNLVTFGDGTPAVHVAPANQPAGSVQGFADIKHTYAGPGTYTAQVTATDAGGRTASTTYQVGVGAAFVSYAPQRFLDTRYGIGAPKKQVGPNSVTRVKIAGVNGIPSTGVSAVTMNVTDSYPNTSSWVTAYADGAPRPNASNLNFHAWQTNPNQITVPVGADGYVDLYNANGNVDLFADVQGYFTTQSTSTPNQSFFNPVVAVPVLNTSYGLGAPDSPVGPGSVTTLDLGSSSAALPNLTSVLLNITASDATANSWVTVFPGTGARPNTSSLNIRAGQPTSNLVVVPLDASGKVRIYNNAGRVNLSAAVEGVYQHGTGPYYLGYQPWEGPFVSMPPTRLVDTRYGIGTAKQRLGAMSQVRIKVAGRYGVPADASAVMLNLTGSWPSTRAQITATGAVRGAQPMPNLVLDPGQTRPVLSVVEIDRNGYVTITVDQGTVDVFADLEGYYGPCLNN